MVSSPFSSFRTELSWIQVSSCIGWHSPLSALLKDTSYVAAEGTTIFTFLFYFGVKERNTLLHVLFLVDLCPNYTSAYVCFNKYH